MNCAEGSTSAYVTVDCEIRLEEEDLNVAGDYLLTVTAKDNDPDKKQKINPVEKKSTFNVKCHNVGNDDPSGEYGICQKKGECSKKIDSPVTECFRDYECCTVGTVDQAK